MPAYAVRISPENFGAICSEKPDFNQEEALKWLEQHKQGYFVRDDESSLDCQYFEDTSFFAVYTFADKDPRALFRRIMRL
jgi:hypothetical protein